MKKRLIALILCVLVVCTMCVSLVACNRNNEDYVGEYVGYIEGDEDFQIYMKFNWRVYGDNVYVVDVYGVFGSKRDTYHLRRELGKTDKSLRVGSGYIKPGEYTISKISKDKFTMTLKGGDVKIHYKRTNLSIQAWQIDAFRIENGKKVPYYYEK